MPNYITNVITVEKGEFDLSTIKSFSDLLPIPEALKNTSQDAIAMLIESILGVGFDRGRKSEDTDKALKQLYEKYPTPENHEQIKQVLSNIENHGYASWYQWCIFNWGTKWDMDICQSDEDILLIQTAWSPPVAWLEELAKTLPDGVELQMEWADEDFGCNTGYATASNTDFIAIDDENGSPQAYSRAVEVLGEPDNLTLVNDEWVWVNDDELEDDED